jgi:hypothetical protein
MPQLSITGGLTPTIKKLLIVVGAAALVWLLGGRPVQAEMVRWLVLDPASLARGEVWKLVTTAFVNPDMLGLIFDVLLMWLFVPVLERWWGSKRFISFFFATTIVGNLVAALAGLVLGKDLVVIAGLNAFAYASIAAFGVLFANHPVALFGAIQMKGKTLALGMLAVAVVLTLVDKAWVWGAGALSAMALAYLMTTGRFTPNLWWLKLRRYWLKRRYRVIDGGKKDPERWIN